MKFRPKTISVQCIKDFRTTEGSDLSVALLVSFISTIVITTRIQWETELYFVYLTFIRQWDISDDHALGLKMGHKLNSKQTHVMMLTVQNQSFALPPTWPC